MRPPISPDLESLSREELEAEVRRLRGHSASLAQMFDQAPSFVALLSGPDHRFTLTNAAYQRVIGDRDVTGRTVAEALPEAAAQGYVDLLDEVFRTGRPHRAAAARFDVQASSDGLVNERYLDFVYQPITDARGAVDGIFVEGYDVTERAHAETALRESEARYRTLFESIEVGFCIAEMKFEGAVAVDYRIAEANPAFVQQTGADVAGRWVSDFAPNLERHWFDTYGRVALTGEPAHFEHYADVFGRWFDVRALRVGDPSAHRVAIFFNDISARRHAEEELQRLNATLEQQVQERTTELNRLWTASPDLLVIIGFDGVLRRVNPAWTASLGYRPDELVGHHVNEFVLPDDHAATVDAYILAAEGGRPQLVNRYRHKDGSIRWISWVAAPSGDVTYATGRDITVEKESAELLRDAQDFARLALSAVGGVGVWTYEVASDRFRYDAAIAELYALDPARGTSGIPRPEFLANVHPDDLASLRAKMSEGLAHSGDLELEYRILRPDGSIRWVLSRGHTHHDESGHPVRRTGVGVETTRQRRTEDALRQAQKMEAVGQLTGGIAHDFNNLLAGISGSLELMQTRIGQGRFADLDRYMAVAQGAAKRAAALTHRLLAFSRRQTLDPKPTNVDRLIADMEELIRRSIGPQVTLEVVGAASGWPALIDPSQLENALLNLCINARDAMPESGRIVIETANKLLDEHDARSHDLSPGQYLSVCVTDTGTGMTPDLVAKVFEPFFTTKPVGQGTGLGLSMVYGFARQSGGQVRIYSEVGRGTTVCLYLPRHYGPTDEDDVAVPITDAIRAEHQETVLIVDDEPSVRMLVTEVLEDLGYSAIEAADSGSGLKVLQSDVRIDLLVTDVGLPGGMNGRQMADAARERRPGLKVLFITGYAENSVIGTGHLDPGMHVMTKPFAMDMLAARIKDLIVSQ